MILQALVLFACSTMRLSEWSVHKQADPVSGTTTGQPLGIFNPNLLSTVEVPIRIKIDWNRLRKLVR